MAIRRRRLERRTLEDMDIDQKDGRIGGDQDSP